MQHNTWGKDRNDLASLAGQVITESYEDGEDKDAEYFKAHGELPESQDDLDNFEASKSEDADKSEDAENGIGSVNVSAVLDQINQMDAEQIEELLHGLYDGVFSDKNTEISHPYDKPSDHVDRLLDAWQSRISN